MVEKIVFLVFVNPRHRFMQVTQLKAVNLIGN